MQMNYNSHTCTENLKIPNYLDSNLRPYERAQFENHMGDCELCSLEFKSESDKLRLLDDKIPPVFLETQLEDDIKEELTLVLDTFFKKRGDSFAKEMGHKVKDLFIKKRFKEISVTGFVLLIIGKFFS